MKININNISGSTVDFDILGKGNVLLDSEQGNFDCSSINDSPEADDDFHDYILDNIDEIIEKISKPDIKQIHKELNNLKELTKSQLLEIADSEKDIVDFKLWCEDALVLLISLEEYENCSIVKRLISYTEK